MIWRMIAGVGLVLVAAAPVAAQEPSAVATQQLTLTLESEVLAKRGRFADAIALQTKAVALDEKNTDVVYALAQRYAAARQEAEAMQHLSAVITTDPVRFKRRAAGDAWFARLSRRRDFKALVQ